MRSLSRPSARSLARSVATLALAAAAGLGTPARALAGDRPSIYDPQFSLQDRVDLFDLISDYITTPIVQEHLSPPLDKHMSPRFLVWHRRYIKGLEDYLISQGRGDFVPLPKWDSNTTTPVQFQNPVDVDCPAPGCAPVVNWAPAIMLPVQLSTNLCSQTFNNFYQRLENVFHNSVHMKMGGVMASFKSPAVPIFWLWHAFVDDVWFDWQCGCGLDEGGAFDTYTAAERNTDLAAGIADAWIQDSPIDIGNEPNTESEFPFESSDIWVRNTRATAVGTTRFLNEHEHENPEYAIVEANRPWIYVKVRNRGCVPITGQVHVYWANASFGLDWEIPHFREVLPAVAMTIGAGREHVAEFHWTDITLPTPATGDHFCLAARFVASPTFVDPINGEGTVMGQNVFNSNQVSLKNVTVVNLNPSNKNVLVRNNTTSGGEELSLHFDVPLDEVGDSYFAHGPLAVDLGFVLFDAWFNNGHRGLNITYSPPTNEVYILGNGSTIDGLPVSYGAEYLVDMKFGSIVSTPCEDDRTVFNVRVTEYQEAFPAATFLGGNTYQIRPTPILPSPEVVVLPLDPTVNCAAGTVRLQVTSGLPGGATLQWYGDDLLIPGETGLMYTATQSGQYTALMTYLNGCDRLSQPVDVQISVAPANDDPCAATYIGLGAPVAYDIYCATADVGEVAPGAGSDPDDGCYSTDGWCMDDAAVQNSLWYRFTAPYSGKVSIHADHSHEIDHHHLTDTQIAVYSATDCGDYGTYTLIAANDNSGNHGVFGSAPALHDLTGLAPGTDYYIQLDGYLGAGGMGMLLVEDEGAPSFCDGSDGSLAACPCANPGNPDSGCEIAQGTGGVRVDLLAQSLSPSGVTLTGTGFSPVGSPAAIVIRAPALDPSSPVVFGDGLRCIGVPLVRLGAAFASGGISTHVFGHGAMAGTGDFYYQIWFRNTPLGFCTPNAFNLSNGVQLTW